MNVATKENANLCIFNSGRGSTTPPGTIPIAHPFIATYRRRRSAFATIFVAPPPDLKSNSDTESISPILSDLCDLNNCWWATRRNSSWRSGTIECRASLSLRPTRLGRSLGNKSYFPLDGCGGDRKYGSLRLCDNSARLPTSIKSSLFRPPLGGLFSCHASGTGTGTA